MAQKLRRLFGRVDVRALLIFLSLTLFATIGWTFAQFSDSSNTIDSYEDLVQRYLDFREKSYPLCVPDWYLYANQIESIESTYGLTGFQEQPDWYVTVNVGDFFVSPKSTLAGQVAHGTKLIIYEDMTSGELLVMRDTGEDCVEEVVYKSPDWPATKSGEPYKNYLFRELSKRRVVWQVTLKDADLAAEEYEAMLAAQEEEEEGGGQMMLLMGGGDELAIAEVKAATNGLLLNIEYTASFTGTIWSAYSYDTPACVDTNGGGGGGGGGDPPPPGTNECTNCVMNCAANETNSFMGLERVWELVYTNLLLTGATFTAWTDTRPMGFDAETNHVNRFYAFGNNGTDTDDDGLSDAFELFIVKSDPEVWDTDNDGMPDGWEVENGFTPLDAGDAQLDADMDGWRNVQEYVETTDPNDRHSNPGFGPGIMINKFVYNPATNQNQWIEIFNRNLLPIDMTDFRLQVSDGGDMPTSFTFPTNAIIQGADFMVIASPGATTGNYTGTLDLEIPYNGVTSHTAAVRIVGPWGDPATNAHLIVDACLYDAPNTLDYGMDGFDDLYSEVYAPYAVKGNGIRRKIQGLDRNIGGVEWMWISSPTPTYPGTVDPDGDGLSTIIELSGSLNPYGLRPTEPFVADCDDDGLSDGAELLATTPTDPWEADTDHDEFYWGHVTNANDGAEGNLGPDPTNPDSDGDGLYDGWEVALGYDPLTSNDHANLDYDGDGISNLAEQFQNSNPNDILSTSAVALVLIEYHLPAGTSGGNTLLMSGGSSWSNGDDMGERGEWLGLKAVGIRKPMEFHVWLREQGFVEEFYHFDVLDASFSATVGRTSYVCITVSDTNLVPKIIVTNDSPPPTLSASEYGSDLFYALLDIDIDVDANYTNGISKGEPDESLELVQGGLVAVGGDREEIVLRQVEPSSWIGNVVLTKLSSKISVYDVPSGGTALTFNGVDNVFSNTNDLPKTLYVQGDSVSGGLAQEVLHFQFEDGCPYDEIAFTVITVALEKCSSGFLPQGGTSDNSTTIRAYVTPDDVKGSFRFTLFDVSDEKGYCLNAPTNVPASGEDSDNWKDFQFPQQALFTISGSDSNVAETISNNLHEATVTIKSFDYGSYGKIKAEFMTHTGSFVFVATEVGGTNEFTHLPADTNGNHIADSWSGDIGPGVNFAATDDSDNTPTGSGVNGDWLTRYEEYRGFFHNGTHIRTSPVEKDIFIHDEHAIGVGYFTSLGYALHKELKATEWDANRRINFNGETAHVNDMYAIWLQAMPQGTGYGATSGYANSGAHSQCAVSDILIAGGNQQDVDSHIGHELGHTIYLLPPSGGGHGHTPAKTCIMDSVLQPNGNSPTTYCNSTVGADSYKCQQEHRLH